MRPSPINPEGGVGQSPVPLVLWGRDSLVILSAIGLRGTQGALEGDRSSLGYA